MPPELSPHLAQTLHALDYTGSVGLLTASDDREVSSRDYYWRDLRDLVGLDAVFFNEGVPIIGFSSQPDVSGLVGIRKRLWNYGRVPLLINANADSIEVFDAASSVPRDDQSAREGRLYETRADQISAQVLHVFNRRQIESGNFDFGMPSAGRRRRVSRRVDKVLLRNLSELKQRMLTRSPDRRADFETLVGGCLIASYLRDRGILSQQHLRELSNLEELDDIFMSGVEASLLLFEGLATRFNGDVFGAIPDSLSRIDGVDLADIAGMLRGDDLTSNQLSLWPYDFSVLPADLVSSVYEELLADTRSADSAFYTPRFVVDLVLDEILPWTTSTQDSEVPRVVDVACGSGAFMIEAFRRIAYLAQSRSLHPLSYEQLSELLTGYIYGVDQNPAAARVAAFGLYLAVLEKVDPPDIWDHVRLPQLIGRNIIVDDAFNDHPLRHKSFDVVVSNPPWMSRLTKPAARYIDDTGYPVADRQTSQAFVWLARDLLRPGGRLGLVLPSKPLLHNRGPQALAFRRALFEQLDVDVVVDLSPLRRSLFSAATAPSAVLVAHLRDVGAADDGSGCPDILHLAARPQPGGVVDALVVAPEDIHMVSVAQARARPDIWKVLLWGSQRDLELLDRIRGRFPSVESHRAQRGWTASQGYKEKGPGTTDASELLGMRIVPAEALGYLQLLPHSIEHAQWAELHRPRSRKLYSAPLTIIRRTLHRGDITAVTLNEDVVFPSGGVGISGPAKDLGLLQFVAAATVSSLGRYWHFMTSASWGVERDFIEVNEFLDLPLPEPNRAQLDRVRRIVNAIGKVGSTPELRSSIDEVVFDVYGLSAADRSRVIDRMATAIERFYGRTPPLGDTSATVDQYESLLTRALDVTLPSLSIETTTQEEGSYRSVAVSLRRRGGQNPTTSSEPVRVDMAWMLERLSRDMNNPTAVISQASGFFIDDDTVFLVKTNDPHRWSRDSALDDAEKIIAAITSEL